MEHFTTRLHHYCPNPALQYSMVTAVDCGLGIRSACVLGGKHVLRLCGGMCAGVPHVTLSGSLAADRD